MTRWLIAARRSTPGGVVIAALVVLLAATACASGDTGDAVVAADAVASLPDPAIDGASSGETNLGKTTPATAQGEIEDDDVDVGEGDGAPRAVPVVAFHPDDFEGVTTVPTGVYDPFTSGEEAPDGFRQLLRRDLIAPVYDPLFVQRTDVGWPDDELVIGVDLEGEARAYPVGFLNRREIVVDLHRGIPTLVTW